MIHRFHRLTPIYKTEDDTRSPRAYLEPSYLRGGGFSLLEVLFAVMILTLGMVFVASQFPIGLAASRTITEKTLESIESHNAEVMTELQLQQLSQQPAGINLIGTNGGSIYFINDDGGVYFWYQPNLRLNGDPGDLIMDDPLDTGFTLAPTVSPPTYIHYPGSGLFTKDQIVPSYIKLLSEFYGSSDELTAGNLGRIVSPPVNGYDAEVLDEMHKRGYNVDITSSPNAFPFDDAKVKFDDWQDAIASLALKRNYSQAMLYQNIATNTYKLWIFTLNATNKNARYAVMDITDFEKPIPLDADQDRRFPVPWRVDLNAPIDPKDTDYFDPDGPWDEFILENYTDSSKTEYVEAILRKGSVLVDATYGHTYKVVDIFLNKNNHHVIRLDRNLVGLHNTEYMIDFWVFPPAVIRDGSNYEFVENHPVMNVVEKIVTF